MSSPRPWWFRLGAWVVALTVAIGTMLLVVRSGSYGATTHTLADEPVPAPDGHLEGSLTEVASYDGASALVGGVVVTIYESGATARTIEDGATAWTYQRSDLPVCAHTVTTSRVLLFYANGPVCNEVVSLEASNGARNWQRTIEADGPNEIIIGDGSFISVGPAKVIVYEQSQGYERFSLAPRVDAAIASTSCEYLDAAGSSNVAVLQRCANGDGEPDSYHVIVNSPSDGKPRETGRTPLQLLDPQLIGALLDGTALVSSQGVLYVVPVGALDPIPVDGVTLDDTAAAATSIAGVAITSGGTGYVLGPDAQVVMWSGPVLAPPYIHRLEAAWLDGSGLIRIDPRTGAESMRAVISPPLSGPVDDVQIVGPYVAVRTGTLLTIYHGG